MRWLKTTKSKILALLVILSLGSLIYLYFKTQPKPAVLAPKWKGVQVGSDPKEKIIEKLGSPISATVSASGSEILNYASKNQYWPDQVYINSTQNRSSLIRERLLNTTTSELQSYLDKYGPPETILASNDDLPAAGFRLYVFPRSGIAVNADPAGGLVFEIWYFPPTTLSQFQTDFAGEITVWEEPQTF